MEKFNLEITGDERFMLVFALATTIAGGLPVVAPPVKDFSALARRLTDLQPSSSIRPAAPETTSPTVAPTRAPAPAAQTRGKDAGAGTREILGKTVEEWNQAGYKFTRGPLANCRYCGKSVEWWETPNGRKTPMEIVPGGRVSHFSTCPKADEARFPALRRAD